LPPGAKESFRLALSATGTNTWKWQPARQLHIIRGHRHERGACLPAGSETSTRARAMPARTSRIAGMGAYLPERVVTNHDLAQYLDPSDEWIVQRTGIHERRFTAPGEGPASMGAEASRRVVADAGWSPGAMLSRPCLASPGRPRRTGRDSMD